VNKLVGHKHISGDEVAWNIIFRGRVGENTMVSFCGCGTLRGTSGKKMHKGKTAQPHPDVTCSNSI
jgi:hypothetical protein